MSDVIDRKDSQAWLPEETNYIPVYHPITKKIVGVYGIKGARNEEEAQRRAVQAHEIVAAKNAAQEAEANKVAGVSKDVADLRSRGLVGRLATGVKGSLENSYLGVKDLFTDLSDEDRRQIAVNEQFLDEDTAGKVGGVLADIGLFAVPGGVAARGLSLATKLPRAAKLAAAIGKTGSGWGKFGANAALDAGLSAAYAHDDRGEAAAMGAIGSALGHALPRAVTGAVRPSKHAEVLLKEGIVPTIGQAADPTKWTGRALRRVEELSELPPLMGGIVTNARERAAKEVAEAVGRRAVAPGGVPHTITREGIDELYKQFKQPYDVLNQYPFHPDPDLDKALIDILDNPNHRASKETVNGVVEFIDHNLYAKVRGGTLSGAAFKDLDSEINRRIRDIAKEAGAEARAERRILTAIDQKIGEWRDRNLPQKVVDQLKETDRAYAAWKRLARAGSYSDDGTISPAQLTRAVRAMSQGDDFARGRAFLQDLTDPAAILRGTRKSVSPDVRVARDVLAGSGLIAGTVYNPPVLFPYASSALGFAGAYSRPAQRMLLGDYSTQRALAKALRNHNANQYFGDVGAAIVPEVLR